MVGADWVEPQVATAARTGEVANSGYREGMQEV